MEGLFRDADGKIYGPQDIYDGLKTVGADDCETLFMHSDVIFGNPVGSFDRKKYLSMLYEVIEDLGVRNIIVPAFTYSFCNHEVYDVNKSRTSMGAFNEFVRRKDHRYRTMDPLLSISVPDHLKGFFQKYDGQHSLGVKSGLDAVHHMSGVKFLFLGADMGSCFTYVHYVEKILQVPYRFDMRFQGTVIDEQGCAAERVQYIHTQCGGVQLPAGYGYFEEELIEKGLVKKIRMGDKSISCLSEKDAFEQISRKLCTDINYFLAKPFTEADLEHKYVYGQSRNRITHC